MLKHQVAVVTGGARGIGKAIALKLASLGADIVVVDYRGREEAEEVCRRCRDEYGVNAKAYLCDVGDFEETKQTVAEIKKDFKTVHILVTTPGSPGTAFWP